jgi:FRG domain
MDSVEHITAPAITTVAGLVDLEEALGQPTPYGLSRRSWSFRGQPRMFGTLIPSLQRQFTTQSFGTAELIERRLLAAFREHYATLKDRSSDMPQPHQIAEGYDLRCLSVMQHYEIPTRLLDWTSGFWIAVYFACASDPAERAELWMYDREIFDAHRRGRSELHGLLDQSMSPPREPDVLRRRDAEQLMELDPRLSPRMKDQQGHHTVSTHVFSDHAGLLLAMRFDAGSSDDPYAGGFQRVPIDAPCKAKALQFLAEEKGITASTIFPDVVGLGRFLRWQFDSLRTMMM